MYTDVFVVSSSRFPFRTRTDLDDRTTDIHAHRVTDATVHRTHASATAGVGFIRSILTITNDPPRRQLHGFIAIRGFRVCSSGDISCRTRKLTLWNVIVLAGEYVKGELRMTKLEPMQTWTT